jgi:hypothetical protein
MADQTVEAIDTIESKELVLNPSIGSSIFKNETIEAQENRTRFMKETGELTIRIDTLRQKLSIQSNPQEKEKIQNEINTLIRKKMRVVQFNVFQTK